MPDRPQFIFMNNSSGAAFNSNGDYYKGRYLSVILNIIQMEDGCRVPVKILGDQFIKVW